MTINPTENQNKTESASELLSRKAGVIIRTRRRAQNQH